MSLLNKALKKVNENCGCGKTMEPNTLMTFLVHRNAADEEEVTTKPTDEDKLDSQIIWFFTNNPSPSDEQIHAFAKKSGMHPDKFEERVYNLLHSFVNCVGKHDATPDAQFDPEQLRQGIEVEKEHTNNTYVAKLIAKDHLAEIPDYYSRLQDMEKGAGIKD